jgi:hypothetical protein
MAVELDHQTIFFINQRRAQYKKSPSKEEIDFPTEMEIIKAEATTRETRPWLSNAATATRRVTCSSPMLKYDFELVYRNGSELPANFLS